ncbi:MAG: hypothetical protein ACRC9T_07805 [Vibrionaceae bacterium]
MADKENYRVAIDILCCHLGLSFHEACVELGLVEDGKVCPDCHSSESS